MSRRRTTQKKVRRESAFAADSTLDSSSPPSPSQSPETPPTRPRHTWWLAAIAVCTLLVAIWLVPRSLTTLGHQFARQEISAYDLDAALGWLQWSQRWSPHNPETHLLFARVYRKQGYLTKSQAQMELAREYGLSLERCDRERWLLQAQLGNLADAEPHLAGLLRDAGQDGSEICETFANGFMLNGRLNRATDLLAAWHTGFPLDPQPHYMFGMIWRHLNHWEKAEKEFRQALRLQPKHASATLALADLLLEQKKYDEALALYERSESFAPLQQTALLGKAACHRRLGNLPAARQSLLQVLKDDPESAGAAAELGQLEGEEGHYEKAREWLERAVKAAPRDGDLRYALAKALAALGETEAAQPHFDYAAAAQAGLARARDLTIQHRDDPKNAAIGVEIGQLLIQFGHEQEGLKWLNNMLEGETEYAPAHSALAAYYRDHSNENREFALRARFHAEKAKALTDAQKATVAPPDHAKP
jgi:tetratricopeptide (TPR) repeat protein